MTTATDRDAKLKSKMYNDYIAKRKRLLGIEPEEAPVISTATVVDTTDDSLAPDGYEWLDVLTGYPTPKGMVRWATRVYEPGYFSSDVAKYIPEPMDGYKYRDLFHTFTMLVDMGYVGALVGESGSGKDEMAKQLASLKRMPYRRITGDKRNTSDIIVGRRTMVDGSILWEPGEMQMICQHGGMMVMAEPFANPPDTLFSCQSAWERGGYLSMTEHPDPDMRMLNLHPDCRMILTTNTRGYGDDSDKYSATGVMDASTLNRLEYMLTVDHLDPSIEAEVILGTVGDMALALKMVRFGNLVRQAWRTGEIEATWSLRSLRPWAEMYKHVGSLSTALRMTFWGKLNDEERGAIKRAWHDIGFGEAL